MSWRGWARIRVRSSKNTSRNIGSSRKWDKRVGTPWAAATLTRAQLDRQISKPESNICSGNCRSTSHCRPTTKTTAYFSNYTAQQIAWSPESIILSNEEESTAGVLADREGRIRDQLEFVRRGEHPRNHLRSLQSRVAGLIQRKYPCLYGRNQQIHQTPRERVQRIRRVHQKTQERLQQGKLRNLRQG